MENILATISSLTEPALWIVVMIVSIIVEAMTAGLVSIWFIGGSLVAMIMALGGVSLWFQVVAFILVSLLLLILIRPLATQWSKKNKTETNVVEALIGKKARVTEVINNGQSTGAVYIEGKTWTARCLDDASVINIGDFVVVESIQGVKLIVKKI